MHFTRTGTGRPLLLIHGLGGSTRSWSPIAAQLQASREVIAVDLPGFGTTPPLVGPVTIDTMADAVIAFLKEYDLLGIDVVGSSMGARLVLELARRGVVGSVVSLDPGGFWQGAETAFFATSIKASLALVNAIQPLLPAITGSGVGRTMLLAQFSAHPWSLEQSLVLQELQNFKKSISFGPMLDSLIAGPMQPGATPQSDRCTITIGWGRYDRVCLPAQAARAQAAFPKARLHWFEHSGHFPMWDSPEETAVLILDATREAGRA
jgi:pimeloyl-ACP methyl ester carboxylesterase